MSVYMRVIFLKIGEIDTMKENFMADAFIQARWREPALDELQSQVNVSGQIIELNWPVSISIVQSFQPLECLDEALLLKHGVELVLDELNVRFICNIIEFIEKYCKADL